MSDIPNTAASGELELVPDSRFPPGTLQCVLALALVPGLLAAAGFGLGAAEIDRAGTVVHTLLGWSAFLLASITAASALARAIVRADVRIILVVIAFLAAGVMEALQVLAADLIEVVATPDEYVPFVWLVCRTLTALLLLGGVWLATQPLSLTRWQSVAVISTTLACGVSTAWAVVYVAAMQTALPAVLSAEGVLHAPLQLLPMALFAVLGLWAMPRLTRRGPSAFAHGLAMSVALHVTAELYMAFGTSRLYDHFFMAAHLLVALAYLLPFCGLLLDFVRLSDSLRREVTQHRQKAVALASAENRQRAVLDTMRDCVVVVDSQGRIESVNPAVSRRFGYPAIDLIGRGLETLVNAPPEADAAGNVAEHLCAANEAAPGERLEVTARRADGREFPAELAMARFRVGERDMITAVLHDITERRDRDRIKNEFISTVSHELRTPLTSIRGSLGLLTGGAAGDLPERAKGLLDIANNNCERLIVLINDILDLEKIAAGNMRFELNHHRLSTLLDTAVAGSRGLADSQGVSLHFETPATDALLNVDDSRFQQVTGNLLSNAIKFAGTDERAAEVRVWSELANGRITIHVGDNGAGIPASFQPHIFERFAQADGSTTRGTGGSGLGLNICRALVEGMGGSITFDTSDAGTTFVVSLPGTPAMEPREPREPTAERTSVTRAGAATRSGRVLVIEDDPDIARLLGEMLAESGMSVDTAWTCSQAREKLQANSYDVATLDLRLPDGSGLALLQELRRQPRLQHMPVLIVSAQANNGELQTHEEICDLDWLPKPVEREQFVDSVRRLAVDGRVPSILHVEDDEDYRAVTETLFAEAGHVTHAASLHEARERLARQFFDVLVLDLTLPDGNGLDLLSLLRGTNTRVLLLSGADTAPNPLDVDVAAFMVKGDASNTQLINTIRELAAQTSPAAA